MSAADQIDQDALAAEWGQALESDAAKARAATEGTAQDQHGAGLFDEGSSYVQAARGGAERVLNQEERTEFPL